MEPWHWFRDVEVTNSIRVLNLGGGRQSSALALAASRGLIEPFDAILFADTGHELPETMEWLDFLQRHLLQTIEVVRRPGETLFSHIQSNLGGNRMSNPPFSTRERGERDDTPKRGGRDPLIQKCTKDWKSTPLERRAKELLGYEKGQRIRKGDYVLSARGITLDEVQRVKPTNPQTKWLLPYYPAIEPLRWRASDCEAFVKFVTGGVPPKSACGGCPHATAERWEHIEQTYPELFAELVDLDKEIRESVPGVEGKCYLHRYAMPLEQAVEWSRKEKEKNPQLAGLEDFGCDDGFCGV